MSYQFVAPSSDEAVPDTVFQVTRGSGMGMRHAGSVADLALHAVLEAPVLTQASRANHGIESYVRFRDDIFVACANARHANIFSQ